MDWWGYLALFVIFIVVVVIEYHLRRGENSLGGRNAPDPALRGQHYFFGYSAGWWASQSIRSLNGRIIIGAIAGFLAALVMDGATVKYDPFEGWSCRDTYCRAHISGYRWAASEEVVSPWTCLNDMSQPFRMGCLQYVDRSTNPIFVPGTDTKAPRKIKAFMTFHGFICTDDCSSHAAGYHWAKKQRIGNYGECREKAGTRSESFLEGCEAYVLEARGGYRY